LVTGHGAGLQIDGSRPAHVAVILRRAGVRGPAGRLAAGRRPRRRLTFTRGYHAATGGDLARLGRDAGKARSDTRSRAAVSVRAG